MHFTEPALSTDLSSGAGFGQAIKRHTGKSINRAVTCKFFYTTTVTLRSMNGIVLSQILENSDSFTSRTPHKASLYCTLIENGELRCTLVHIADGETLFAGGDGMQSMWNGEGRETVLISVSLCAVSKETSIQRPLVDPRSLDRSRMVRRIW